MTNKKKNRKITKRIGITIYPNDLEKFDFIADEMASDRSKLIRYWIKKAWTPRLEAQFQAAKVLEVFDL